MIKYLWAVIKDKDTKGGEIEVIFGEEFDLESRYSDAQSISYFDNEDAARALEKGLK